MVHGPVRLERQVSALCLNTLYCPLVIHCGTEDLLGRTQSQDTLGLVETLIRLAHDIRHEVGTALDGGRRGLTCLDLRMHHDARARNSVCIQAVWHDLLLVQRRDVALITLDGIRAVRSDGRPRRNALVQRRAGSRLAWSLPFEFQLRHDSNTRGLFPDLWPTSLVLKLLKVDGPQGLDLAALQSHQLVRWHAADSENADNVPVRHRRVRRAE